MKIGEIVEALAKHEISKQEAIDKLTEIVNGFRGSNSIEFDVEEVSFCLPEKHGYLKLKLPYQYHKIESRVKVGDRVDVVFLP